MDMIVSKDPKWKHVGNLTYLYNYAIISITFYVLQKWINMFMISDIPRNKNLTLSKYSNQ